MADQAMSIDEVKKQCVFCHIVAGRVASKKVYEDDKVTAVLDINPANLGHVLVLSKEHYAIMPQIPDDEIGHLGMIAKAISSALLAALKAQGTSVVIANGVAAGQRAQHFMLHVIPRMEDDGLGIELPERKISQDKLKEIRAALLPVVAKVLGKAAESGDKEEKDENKEEELPKKESPKKSATKNKDDDAGLDDIARLLGA